MNKGQEKFFDFIMKNVTEENVAKAKKLLTEAFEKQDNDALNNEYLKKFIPQMLDLIKPEKVDTVKKLMTTFMDEKK